MDSLVFFLGALALIGFSFLLVWNTSPYADCSSGVYEKKRARRLVGRIVLFMGMLALGISVLSEYYATNP